MFGPFGSLVYLVTIMKNSSFYSLNYLYSIINSENFLFLKLFFTGFANRSLLTVNYIIILILSQGVNLRSIKTLVEDEKILTFNEALQCTEYKLFDPVVQSDVQSAFFTYLVSTLVDKTTEECGTDLENIWFIYVSQQMVGVVFS